jgi:tRNA(Ile)-lysidine synthase
MMSLLHKVRQTIQKHSLLITGDKVLIGLSGGPDSMALLDVLSSLKEEFDLTLFPAHLNHGFRGKEAEEDLAFCEKAAARYGLRLISETVDLPALIQEQGLSTQAAARDVRYDFFMRQAEAHGASKIALAHHADDQAETVLMRLIRGTGPRGLSGIPVARPQGIIRPLIHVTREEILDYLAEREIPYRQDSSNRKTVYLRNRIRRELIPMLVEGYNPNLVADLNRTAEILGEEDDYLQKEAGRLYNPIRISEGLSLDLAGIRDLPQALVRRIVRLAIEETAGGLLGITFRHVDSVIRIMTAAGSSSRVDLPHGLKARKVYERLEFIRESESIPYGVYELPVPGRELIPVLSIEVVSRILSPEERQPSLGQSTAFFDLDKCALPLSIRTREPGDVFYPSGFGKKKKVKRFFIDEKVPYPMRDRVPLLVNRDNQILWVGGFRTDTRFGVDAETDRTLLVKISPINGEQNEISR